jgi:effector-binding domain-containing protein
MKTKSIIRNLGCALLLGSVYSGLTFCQGEPVIEVKNIEAQKALVIKGEVLSSEIGPKMGEMYGKLFAYTAKNNIQPVGAPFAVYYSFDPKGKTTFEAGYPISDAATCSEGIEVKEYPAMKVVTTLFIGAYENMSPVYEKLQAYMVSNNLKANGASWEIYLTNPQEVANPNENRTIIYFPIE